MDALAKLPESNDADAVLAAFLEHVESKGLTLYSAQEEAILALLDGQNVVLATPTGSGKSLVAEALHFASLAAGKRSYYTAPIKALVSEKFFALCRTFGAENVGMLTGDASINRDAPIVCCTAEILANIALLEGIHAKVDHVVMDEFHFYADRERGVAWQVPLLELPQAQFLLMSATLGETEFFERELTELTHRPTTLVKGMERPVPLDFAYRETPIHESIAELIETQRAPVYVVHFTQRAAVERAQDLLSVDFLTKDQKHEIQRALHDRRFDSPFGKTLKRFLAHGVGVHHAGLLPRYRLLVEKLTGQGLLKVVCGTDTLGVGVNVPIRTVLITQLAKYDGKETRILSVREFHQVAGRAGRKGFDDSGTVWVQAPDHVIENKQIEKKVAGDPGKRKKIVWRKPPDKGYAHWDEGTFKRLVEGTPEQLHSSFHVSHAMVLQLLSRPEGCKAVRSLLRRSHESVKRKRWHGRRAIAIIRSLRDAGVIAFDRSAPGVVEVRKNEVLQPDFSMHQALSPFLLHILSVLPADVPEAERPLAIVSLVESTLENPRDILRRQVDAIKTEAIAIMKAEGMEYEERMEELEKIEHPKPLADFIYPVFNEYAKAHPWLDGENVQPKSVVRDMYELGASFHSYVRDYGLERMEGTLLRYLSDAYKALVQTVPEALKDPLLEDIIEWLGAIVRQADASLIEEWERMIGGEDAAARAPSRDRRDEPEDITRNERAFTALVRNEAFRFVRFLAFRRYGDALSVLERSDEWPVSRLEEAMAGYFAEHESLRVDASARHTEHVRIEKGDGQWRIAQTLLDPSDARNWFVAFRLDLGLSREHGRPMLFLEELRA